MPRFRLKRLLGHAGAALIAVGAAACATHRTETGAFQEEPQRLWSPPLAYPDSLMLAGIEGSVVLLARLDTNGRVDCSSVRVLRSTHAGFESSAIETLCATRFRPARSPDGPTPAVVELPVRFELKRRVVDSVSGAEALARGARLARAGAIEGAMAAFSEAQQFDTRLSSSPGLWRTLCWYGSVWGYAEDVIGTCNHLVTLDPADRRARDARGIARVLTGDFAGAVADFEAVIATPASESQRAERAEWVRLLRAGQNPLTPEVVERLRSRTPTR